MSLISMKLYKDGKIYSNLKNIEADIEDDIIDFIVKKTNNSFDFNNDNCIYTRENSEFRFVLDIGKNNATFLLKETNSEFDIKVEKCILNKKNNLITIEYQLETDDCLNKIELEMVDSHEKFFE